MTVHCSWKLKKKKIILNRIKIIYFYFFLYSFILTVTLSVSLLTHSLKLSPLSHLLLKLSQAHSLKRSPSQLPHPSPPLPPIELASLHRPFASLHSLRTHPATFRLPPQPVTLRVMGIFFVNFCLMILVPLGISLFDIVMGTCIFV